MPCYHPLRGYRARTLNSSGKRNIVFNVSEGFADMPIELACGQCIGCRLARSREWAIRCVHEASLYESNCFLTLTYAPDHVPKDFSLNKSHFQKFMKRLRKRFSDKENNPYGITFDKIRFFHCGEYGEQNARPHYHAIIFNCDFPDKLLWKTINGNAVYTSELLSRLWPYGFSSIGAVTFQSAAYVARYITKKVLGKDAWKNYTTIDSRGEILSERTPEYTTMSRRPGIGKDWMRAFPFDVFPHDFVVIRDGKGKPIKRTPPKYYMKILEQWDPVTAGHIKIQRKVLAEMHEENNTRDRLDVRELLQLEKFKRLKRGYETNET